MQTYQTRRKSPGRGAMPGKGQALSKSEMLHLSGAGAPQPMSPALREKFEPGFQADFSNIRISRGHIPQELGVQAVAQGTDILLDQSAGMDVLGHELAHVVQQAQGRVDGGYPVVENAALEHEADVMGARVASGLTAQAGAQNGFGGEMLSIAPMSSASAPAQCKSKLEKQTESAYRKFQKAGGMKNFDAKTKYMGRMKEIVNNLSDEQIHDPEVQKHFVSMAGSRTNKILQNMGKNNDWDLYAGVLRGSDTQAEQVGMSELMMRLMGGRDQIKATLQSQDGAQTSDEEKNLAIFSDFAGQVSNNAEIRSMLTELKKQSFAGIDAAAISGDEAQNAAVMSNFMTRVINGGAAPSRAGEAPNKAAIARAVGVQKLAATDPTTGQLSRHQSPTYQQALPTIQNFMNLPGQQQAPAPTAAPAPATTTTQATAPAPTQSQEFDWEYTRNMLDRAQLNSTVPPEWFDEVSDERGVVDPAKLEAKRRAAAQEQAAQKKKKGFFSRLLGR